MSQIDMLMEMAQDVIRKAQQQGADEVSVAVSRASHVTLQRRDRAVEQAQEAITQGLALSVTRNQRYTTNSTNDLRPSALDEFIKRSVEATSFLEPDPYRRLPEAQVCGRGASEADLDHDDPAWSTRTADDRAELALAMEEALLEQAHDTQVSCSAYTADGRSESVRALSNGFADATSSAFFTVGGDATLAEGDKRPEGGAYYAARYLSDLPGPDAIAQEVRKRVGQRIGSRAAPSGSYPMLLENRVVGRLLGVLGSPLSGGALHQGRSILADQLGKRITSEVLTVVDDPTIPRGLGSRPWDGDCLVAKPRTIIANGVLEQFNIDVYYGRKLDRAPTSGGRSNWVITPGSRSPTEMAAELDRAILVTSFLGGNSNGTTGDFSFGIRGLLLEKGEVVQSLSEMNVTGNILALLQQLVEVGNDVWAWSATRSPTLRFEDVQFSGT